MFSFSFVKCHKRGGLLHFKKLEETERKCFQYISKVWKCYLLCKMVFALQPTYPNFVFDTPCIFWEILTSFLHVINEKITNISEIVLCTRTSPDHVLAVWRDSWAQYGNNNEPVRYIWKLEMISQTQDHQINQNFPPDATGFAVFLNK